MSLILAGCAGAPVPAGFVDAAATAPDDMPARLWIDGEAAVAFAAGVGPGGLPAAVRSAVEAVAPAGELVFAGREWSAAGEGFRVEKRYVDGTVEAFRTVLVAADGTVLERSHTVPLDKVPGAVLSAMMRIGRDVRRCEIVSGPSSEQGWRAVVVDGGGRRFEVTVGLQGDLRTSHRLVDAVVRVPQR